MALLAVIGSGLILWGINYGYNRPIFLDEANLARNLYDRSFAGLFLPLDHEQYAPPLYLVLTKALAEVFGYHEYVLRLPALIGGLLGVAAIAIAGRALRLGFWTLLPLAFLFANPTVLRYVTEFKPYGVDFGVAAGLLSWELRRPGGQRIAWSAVGMVLPWLSLPSVFVLAAIGLRRLWRDTRWIAVIMTWVISFGCLYTLVLSPSVGSTYLNAFHAEYFMPLPIDGYSLRHAGRLVFYLLRLFFGFTIVALLWGAVTLAAGLYVARLRERIWLLLPFGIVVSASALQFYTLIDRLMVFTLPGIWLFTGLCAAWIYRRLSGWRSIVYVILTVVTLGGTNIYRAMLQPYRFSDSRRLAKLTEEGNYIADGSAVAVLDYYLRVKPGLDGNTNLRRPTGSESDLSGEVRILFDGTNNAATKQAIDGYRNRAAERRCEAEWENLFRSGSLTLKCP